ncbi:MAG: hypothetical protein JW901_10320 [Dehalococcoidia bacterium]|nr:hypothetical protein [Dehalococcoidia bacterium]
MIGMVHCHKRETAPGPALKGPLAALLASLFLVISLMLVPAPVRAFSLGLEPVSGKVGSTIKIPAFCQYGSGDYRIYWGEDDQLIQKGTVDSKGCSPIYFTVPETQRGKHIVTLEIGSKSWSRDFTVTASITLDVKTGSPGSLVTIQGNGFEEREGEIFITFDGSRTAQDIEANSKGAWTYKLEVPSKGRGSHSISAAGASTPSQEVGNENFEIRPAIEVKPSSGWVGRVVNVSGCGFALNEPHIAVSYDDVIVKSGLTADDSGTWQTSFSIPPSAKGSHKLDAHGSISPDDEVTDVTFTVAPGIHVEQAAHKLGEAIHVGDSLVVTGIGYENNETRIMVMFDGVKIVDNIQADAQGSWSAQFSIPETGFGDHSITAYGDATRSTDVAEFTILVSPDLSINPDSGAVGDSMVLTGHGFGSNEALTFIYNFKKLDLSASADFKGNFNMSFQPPAGSSGPHTLTVMDGEGAADSVTLTIESNPPQAPSLTAPEDGAEYGFFDSEPVAFSWSAVEDSSGVTYTLEISPEDGFKGDLISRQDLEKPLYHLPRNERPSFGLYFWRVKAVDLAGNVSAWSETRTLEFSGSNLIGPGLISLAVLVIIILIIWRIRVVSKKGGWKLDSDSDS